ncbi:MAG: hypothetical protein AVDCRST_MAG56-5331 [uncultured Cytophagales bacterium]|uniref:Uncharacterized protein n=1 Tax=uncultured Cytophagales bacterium TaxID=158755 RepID=A0A6J4KA92_9SPHI|nr:MAG: hypothetical protein AVDCRST_MAG56-5331 [uncultured Cytophagales bacterium]
MHQFFSWHRRRKKNFAKFLNSGKDQPRAPSRSWSFPLPYDGGQGQLAE